MAFALRKECTSQIQAANIYTALLKDMSELVSAADTRRQKFEAAHNIAAARPADTRLAEWLSQLLPEGLHHPIITFFAYFTIFILLLNLI